MPLQGIGLEGPRTVAVFGLVVGVLVPVGLDGAQFGVGSRAMGMVGRVSGGAGGWSCSGGSTSR